VFVIVAAAVGGVLFAVLGQPVITGYIMAGSLIGPGCFGLINELVQVRRTPSHTHPPDCTAEREAELSLVRCKVPYRRMITSRHRQMTLV
jgi:hypothetical protein